MTVFYFLFFSEPDDTGVESDARCTDTTPRLWAPPNSATRLLLKRVFVLRLTASVRNSCTCSHSVFTNAYLQKENMQKKLAHKPTSIPQTEHIMVYGGTPTQPIGDQGGFTGGYSGLHRRNITRSFHASPMIQGSADWNWSGSTPSSSILENAAEKLRGASA